MLISLQPLGLCLEASFLQTNDAAQWNINRFKFGVKDRRKCRHGLRQEIEPGLLDHPSSLYDSHLLRGFENGSKFS